MSTMTYKASWDFSTQFPHILIQNLAVFPGILFGTLSACRSGGGNNVAVAVADSSHSLTSDSSAYH